MQWWWTDEATFQNESSGRINVYFRMIGRLYQLDGMNIAKGHSPRRVSSCRRLEYILIIAKGMELQIGVSAEYLQTWTTAAAGVPRGQSRE